jgi:glyoxylase-like metal-dependent hydrolase (beta-lactamase superfamily II)
LKSLKPARPVLLAFLQVSLASSLLLAQAPNPDGAGVEPGTLPRAWRTGGPVCAEVPPWQVQQYNADFYILRESGCTNYEKPFLFLIFGRDRVLLQDTGAGDADTFNAVNSVIKFWLEQHHRASIPLLVVHSHGHDDHTAGDPQFKNKAGIEFVPATVTDIQRVAHIANWPQDFGSIDLGERVLDVIPIPGHETAAISIYDRRTGVLLTGDSLYPGRLYVRDFAAFVASTQRLVDFTSGKIVAQILGNHIEQMREPYKDYKVGTPYQPEEHSLELGRGELLELNEGLKRLNGKEARVAYRDFTIWPAE